MQKLRIYRTVGVELLATRSKSRLFARRATLLQRCHDGSRRPCVWASIEPCCVLSLCSLPTRKSGLRAVLGWVSGLPAHKEIDRYIAVAAVRGSPAVVLVNFTLKSSTGTPRDLLSKPSLSPRSTCDASFGFYRTEGSLGILGSCSSTSIPLSQLTLLLDDTATYCCCYVRVFHPCTLRYRHTYCCIDHNTRRVLPVFLAWRKTRGASRIVTGLPAWTRRECTP